MESLKVEEKKEKKLLILIATVLLSCLVLSAVVYVGYTFLGAPLGERLNMTRPQATATPVVAAVQATQPVLKGEQPVQPTQKGACGSTGATTILFTGSDMNGGVEPRGADAIRLVKVDFDHKKITVVAFPRDLWVSTPAMADLNVNQARLGQAYFTKKEATNGAEQHRITVATTLLAQTLYDNFAAEPQNYFTLEMKDVPDMINAVGGVEVNVPQSFTSDHNVSFAYGPQLLDGQRAYEFVRTLGPGGDAARMQRQNLFVKGLQSRVISTDILAKLPELVKQFDKMLFTDLSPNQLVSLGCMAKEVPQEQITFHEVSGDLVTSGPHGEMNPDVEKIKAKLQEWFAE